MFKSGEYWENRYKTGGNSGVGSYNSSASFKANTINSIIKELNIKSVVEYGHGDGNQLKLYGGFESYTGYDISPSVRDRCVQIFYNNTKIKFVDSITKLPHSDLALSIDVIYHLVEEEVYEEYIKNLFSRSKYVLIYTMDSNKQGDLHVKSRETSLYISENIINYTLLRTIPGYRKEVVFLLYKIN